MTVLQGLWVWCPGFQTQALFYDSFAGTVGVVPWLSNTGFIL